MIRSSKVNVADDNGRTALHKAAEIGRLGEVRELLDQGAEVNARDQWGFTPLHYAALSGDTDLIEALIARGAEVNASAESNSLPLHYAIMANRMKAAKLLVTKGSQIDSPDLFGQTPLDRAALNGNPQLLESFAGKEGDASIDLVGMLNHSPVHRAAFRGHTMIMEILLGKGAQLEAVDNEGRTPLHWAAMGGRTPAAELLISKGSQVDARDNTGRTPLHEAALNGHDGVLEFLLEKGAGINTRDNEGRTPLHFARQYAREKTAQLLTAKGAESETKDDLPSPLKRQLNEKEAIMWHLGHCGWAVKTQNHLLIFDYWQRTPKPADGCLANGFIDPNEIKDLDVTVFVTHAHPDHYDQVIFQWEPLVKNINYVFGWDAKKGHKHTYLKKNRASTKIKGMEIFTIYSHHDDVPEVAYLVEVDSLVIYHSGDYNGTLRSFKDDIDYLAQKCAGLDIAFFGAINETGRYTMERMLPKAAFPMHFADTELFYKGIVRHFTAKYPKTTFLAPESRGDRYLYQDGKIKQLL